MICLKTNSIFDFYFFYKYHIQAPLHHLAKEYYLWVQVVVVVLVVVEHFDQRQRKQKAITQVKAFFG